ncbi:DNA/RNA nuclease SfsA [Phenylobacterium sp.]|uniref:DNA/RNA nuclease SfsA n=1 Tax=Phenylobacterium sp. TaxID=1871053 RepID=UPI0035B43030
MDFPQPLVRGRLIQRYKRFLADVVLDDGSELTAHCPNPGAMLGLNTPGLTCWLSKSPDPKRKLAYTLELVEADGGLVGINTMHPNRLAAEALAAGAIPELTGYASIRREVKYGQASRVDFLLQDEARAPCWLEIKNVHLMRTPGLAEFPDCVAARSLKHLRELTAEVEKGARAVMLYVVQRTDCDLFDACADLDPAYAAGLKVAAAQGVEVLCYGCDISETSIRIARRIPWRGANAGPE